MSIIKYIPAEVLKGEGFIHNKDKDGLARALLAQSPELSIPELSVVQVAAYLSAKTGETIKQGRVYWYLRHKGLPQRLTIEQMLTMDWSEITDKDKRGDNKRKRTYIRFDNE